MCGFLFVKGYLKGRAQGVSALEMQNAQLDGRAKLGVYWGAYSGSLCRICLSGTMLLRESNNRQPSTIMPSATKGE